ncbi:hypothetical protein AHAS_Ahas13G0291800 [Arachis hypogaea]
MEVNGGKGLVSMVVQSYFEEVVHWHMMELAGNYKGVHHIYCLGMHCRMVVVHGILEGDVAERVDQILVAPSISDYFDLDACSCNNFHSLQQHWDQTQSDGGENS